MTLINNVAVSDKFVVITSDRRVIELKDSGEYEQVSSDHKKGLRLTERVLMSGGGVVKAIDDIRELLIEKVKPEYDLTECGRILNEITAAYDKSKIDVHPDFYIFVVLTGFFEDGQTGYVQYSYPDGGFEIRKAADYEHYSAFPNKHDEDAVYNCLELTPNERKNIEFSDIFPRLTNVHALVSYLSPFEVSTQCDACVLVRYIDDEGSESFHYSNKEADVADLHKTLLPVDELKFKLAMERANKEYEATLSS